MSNNEQNTDLPPPTTFEQIATLKFAIEQIKAVSQVQTTQINHLTTQVQLLINQNDLQQKQLINIETKNRMASSLPKLITFAGPNDRHSKPISSAGILFNEPMLI